MLVTLIGRRGMYKTVIPELPVGNYWISNHEVEPEKKLVSIEGLDGSWQIASNEHIKIINPSSSKGDELIIDEKTTVDKISLKEYSMYYIYIEEYDEIFILYCSPVYEEFKHYSMSGKGRINIGNNEYNHIIYSNGLIMAKHTSLTFDNYEWTLTSHDSTFGTFVNNQPVQDKEVKVNNWDIIFIMGLKIIIAGETLFINNPRNRVKLDAQKFELIPDDDIISNMFENDDTDVKLFSEEDYFLKAPRITNLIEEEKIKIDGPPAAQKKEEMPLILTMGSMLSMGAVMMVSTMTSLQGLASGTLSFVEAIPTLLVAVAMLCSIILFPVLTRKYQDKQKVKYEEKRQRKYKEYIDSKIEYIDSVMNKQRDILFKNYPSAAECEQIIVSKNVRLWERNIEEQDFLSIRVGIGNTPLKADIQYPEKKFSLEDDNLVDILDTIANKSKILNSVPIVTSLLEKNISAIISHNNKEMSDILIKNIIMQLVTLQSYADLKLVFLLKEENKEDWEYINMLPHVWDSNQQMRFIAYNYNDIKDIARFLEAVYESRQSTDIYDKKDYRSYTPYYLIITDDFRRIKDLKVIDDILKMKSNIGFSLLCIADNIMQLPNECKSFIALDGQVGTVFDSEITSKNKIEFQLEINNNLSFSRISQVESNIPIKTVDTKEKLLPNTYTFLEMYDVGRIEQLNIMQRWTMNDSTESLKAPIGIDDSGMIVSLDIHEKYHGPHGLIAGSTGSGKSEFIITYILSLAINFKPDDVSFLLIDYKGGGLAGAFKKRDIQLPHLVGTITNIDAAGLSRSLASIQSELRRRQVMFNEARNMIEESTIDIYKYQKMYHEGIVKEPVPHLLIICDEFAELKQQQPDFMDELISVARIGRSLGVHLILATQKPSGIVNDQIRSNSKFAVCLKVQNKADSNDVIKRPDAANLTQTGRFYLQVGNDEYFILAQSAWAGAAYFKSDVVKKQESHPIEFISDSGVVIKSIDNNLQVKTNVESLGDQLTNIVKYVAELAKTNNLIGQPLWLDEIPENIYLNELKKKYNIKKKANIIEPVLGEYDDPFNQRQGPVKLDLTKGGNTIIYGNASSGKETLLATVIYDVITNYSTNEAQLYILDFGTESLKVFRDSNSVGDVVFINNEEKIGRFFSMIMSEIKERISLLSDYNGEIDLYKKKTGNDMPTIISVINGYESFFEIYGDKYDDTFQAITRDGQKCGIVFIMTVSTSTDVRYRLGQNFKQKLVLQMNTDDEYMRVLDKVGKKRPAALFGRGLVRLDDDEIYEFQTAKICEAENWNEQINEAITRINNENTIKADRIPVLPSIVNFDDVKSAFKGLTAVPVGIDRKTLKPVTWNVKKKFISIISGKNIEKIAQFTSNIIEVLKKIEKTTVIVLDVEGLTDIGNNNLDENYKILLSAIEKESANNTICVIVGIESFLNSLDDSSKFINIIKNAEKTNGFRFIFVETLNKFKNHQFDEWYKKYVSGDCGIWVGKGITEQFLISLNSVGRSLENNCGDDYGYYIFQGETTMIKLLGMKGKEEDG